MAECVPSQTGTTSYHFSATPHDVVAPDLRCIRTVGEQSHLATRIVALAAPPWTATWPLKQETVAERCSTWATLPLLEQQRAGQLGDRGEARAKLWRRLREGCVMREAKFGISYTHIPLWNAARVKPYRRGNAMEERRGNRPWRTILVFLVRYQHHLHVEK
jgi:hypothetical protein